MKKQRNTLATLQNNLHNDKPFLFGTLCLHLCDSCQLRCTYCNYKSNKRAIFLKERTLAFLRQLEFLNVVIVGGGEPTFGASRSDRFSLVLQSLNAHHIGLITNGVEFPIFKPHTRKPNWVRVSLDACTKETYARLKKMDFFETVVRNLRKYHGLGLDFLGIGFTVTKDNVRDIPLLPALLREHGLDDGEVFVQFKFLRGYAEMLPSERDLAEASAALSSNAASVGLDRFFSERTNLHNLPTFFLDRTYLRPTVSTCYYCLLYLLVKANGDIYPCGSMAFRSLNKLGNANKVDANLIVDSVRQFYEARVPQISPDCVGCWDDHINVGMHTYLENEPDQFRAEEFLFPYPFSRFWG